MPAGAPVPLPAQPSVRLAEVQRRLRAVHGFDSEAIPPAARSPLVELRRASVDFIATEIDTLAAALGGRLAALADRDIESAIESAARAAGVEVAERGSSMSTNGLWAPSVTRSKRNPRYLVVGFYFAVPCGNDGGYLLYDIESSPPKRILTVTSPDGESIEPMFWNLAFALPPPGRSQDLFFVVTRITPWCQSAARQLQLLALRPTGDPNVPEVMVDVTVGQHLLKPFRLDVGRGSILLETDDGTTATVRRWVVKDGRAVAPKP